MINLLPPDLKEEYRYARRNTSLLRWLVLFGLGLAGLGLLSVAGLIYLQQAANSATAQVTAAENSLRNQNQKQVKAEVKDISSSLKLAVQVLSNEVLFSKLLKQLAVVTPNNVSLSNLSITELTGGVDVTAKTTDYAAATQLQVNLADPANQIFESADIVSITCVTPTGTDSQSQYPCTVVIRALFAKNNPFLFINNKAGS